MKQRFFNIAMLLLCCAITSRGEVVDVNNATKKAAEFLAKTDKASGAKASAGGIKNVTLAASTPEYYIFNSTDGTGFVIISAESETTSVLAYSNEGKFYTENLPDGIKYILDGYSEQIKAVRSKQSAPAKEITATYVKKELETATYNQTGTCFNENYSPIINGQKCHSGCVATAMAILMRYHQWPERGMGSISYTTNKHKLDLSMDFSEQTFNWSKMPMKTDMTAEESDEVSHLLKTAGVSVMMDYGTLSEAGSSAFNGRIGYALREFFNYDMCDEINRKDFDDATWKQLLRNEIDNGRIVIVSGSSNVGGHAFVLDGYDENGVFRYNMGWGGFNNGYYTDGLISEDKYSMEAATLSIKPRELGKTYDVSPITIDLMKPEVEGNIINNAPFSLEIKNISNISTTPFTGMLAIALCDKKENIKAIISSTGNISGLFIPSFYPASRMTCNVPNNVKIDPTDKIWAVTSEDGGETWKLCNGFSTDYCTYNVSGHKKDMPAVSPLVLPKQSNITGTFNTDKFSLGTTFNATITNIINWGGIGDFNGELAVALFDGVTNNIKSVVSSWTALALKTNSYAPKLTINNCKVTSSMNPYSEDYLGIVTRTAAGTSMATVKWQNEDIVSIEMGSKCASLKSKKEVGYKIVNHFLGKDTTELPLSDADTNEDGKVTIADANKIFNTLK